MAGISQASTYALSSWVFLRLLGLIYLAAFASLALQIKGLAGQQGILPAVEFLRAQLRLGRRRWVNLPTLCWFSASDAWLLLLSWGGTVLAVFLTIDVAPWPALVLLWVLYLSLFTVCRLFLSYQWDVLLLETGFLAIWLAPSEIMPRFPSVTEPPVIIIWLFWWLLFRLMFSSGIVKLRSGDLGWRMLSALCHHYQTQPLPTPLAWFVHQLPKSFHRASVMFVLAIELAVPLLIFAPAPYRYLAAGLFFLLMVLIEATGNYCFFNLLGIALSLLLLDDHAVVSVFNWIHPAQSPFRFTPAPPAVQALSLGISAIVLLLSFEPVVRLFRYEFNWLKPLRTPLRWLAPFHLVSSYGLFAVMTTERPEIIVEGSNDGVTWLAYEFKWKPGDPKRPPRFVAPHQPRLDWQMWFAALGSYQNNHWFIRFLGRLLEGSPEVLRLLKNNPFPHQPPKYVRSALFDYRFSNLAELRSTGAWWRRERRELYSPMLELDDAVEAR
jgi:lipase maturation factor 1